MAVLLPENRKRSGVLSERARQDAYLFIVLDLRTGLLQTDADKIENCRQYCAVVVLLLYYFYCVVLGNILGGRTLQTSPIASVY